MSLDNGVYILATEGPEYRVAYCHAIDNIYGTYVKETDSWLPNVENIVKYFGAVPKVYKDLEEALDMARSLEVNFDYTEDGVLLINEFKQYSFADFVEKAEEPK